MSKAAKKIRFQTDLDVIVRPAPFRPAGNLKFLDFDKLRTRRARLEVGEFEGGCCPTKLYAVVERGMVVRVELEKTKGTKPPPAFLKPILAKAVKSLTGRGTTDFEPMPVEEYVRALQTPEGPSGPRTSICFFLELDIPWVGKRTIGCCVTWHRDGRGNIVIDEMGCGDILSFQY